MAFDPSHPAPIVSIGMLTRNAGKLFVRVMDALLAQKTDWPFEIVVLDSASKDGTDTYAASRGAKVIPYRPAKFRFGPARDTLFELTRGQVIVTISQDVVPADELWLDRMCRPILEDRADATVGQQRPPEGGHTFYWDYHGSWLRSVDVGFDKQNGRIAISCANLAIRRSVWDKLRFGDTEVIEDRFIQVKLHQVGARMMQIDDAWSLHGHDYTWKELTGRLGSFAQGWARMGRKYTLKRLVRDLTQPSRYGITLEAFLSHKLVNWLELVYPVAMCFVQYKAARVVPDPVPSPGAPPVPSPGTPGEG